jgi:antitoxin (DNA-binding transcriptional repressor) of toxin-antitoxin stability system
MNTIGIKELQANLKKVKIAIEGGEEFVVTFRKKPVFKIVPFNLTKTKEKTSWANTLKDLEAIKFESEETDLSEKIDEIAWE